MSGNWQDLVAYTGWQWAFNAGHESFGCFIAEKLDVNSKFEWSSLLPHKQDSLLTQLLVKRISRSISTDIADMETFISKKGLTIYYLGSLVTDEFMYYVFVSPAMLSGEVYGTLSHILLDSQGKLTSTNTQKQFLMYCLIQIDQAGLLNDSKYDLIIDKNSWIHAIPIPVQRPVIIYSVMDWVEGRISNYQYLMIINALAGRFPSGDPNRSPILPWVTDFSTDSLVANRDLTKTKYRLCKGDIQLDMTFQSDPPHHFTDQFSDITYFVYKARRMDVKVLKHFVRGIYVAEEYPENIKKMYDWTPDECIPEFFSDPNIFKSINANMPDLGLPLWANDPEDFVKKHADLLESDAVSEQLHEWIDLIFGYKLSGMAAINAKNVALSLVPTEKYMRHGIVQIFQEPHPQKIIASTASEEKPRDVQITRFHQKYFEPADYGSDYLSDLLKRLLTCHLPFPDRKNHAMINRCMNSLPRDILRSFTFPRRTNFPDEIVQLYDIFLHTYQSLMILGAFYSYMSLIKDMSRISFAILLPLLSSIVTKWPISCCKIFENLAFKLSKDECIQLFAPSILHLLMNEKAEKRVECFSVKFVGSLLYHIEIPNFTRIFLPKYIDIVAFDSQIADDPKIGARCLVWLSLQFGPLLCARYILKPIVRLLSRGSRVAASVQYLLVSFASLFGRAFLKLQIFPTFISFFQDVNVKTVDIIVSSINIMETLLRQAADQSTIRDFVFTSKSMLSDFLDKQDMAEAKLEETLLDFITFVATALRRETVDEYLLPLLLSFCQRNQSNAAKQNMISMIYSRLGDQFGQEYVLGLFLRNGISLLKIVKDEDIWRTRRLSLVSSPVILDPSILPDNSFVESHFEERSNSEPNLSVTIEEDPPSPKPRLQRTFTSLSLVSKFHNIYGSIERKGSHGEFPASAKPTAISNNTGRRRDSNKLADNFNNWNKLLSLTTEVITPFNFLDLKLRELSRHESPVKILRNNESVRLLASAGKDKFVYIWSLDFHRDIETFAESKSSPTLKLSHSAPVNDMCFLNRQFLACSDRLVLWDYETGKIINQYSHQNEKIEFCLANCGQLLTATSEGHMIRLLDARLKRQIGSWNIGSMLNECILTAAATSTDGKLLAVGYSDGSLWIYDAEVGQLLSSWKAYETEISQIVFTSTNKALIVFSVWSTIIGIHQISGESLLQMTMTLYIKKIALSDQTLVIIFEDNSLGLFHILLNSHQAVVTSNQHHKFSHLKSDIWELNVLCENQMLALGHDNGTVSLWS